MLNDSDGSKQRHEDAYVLNSLHIPLSRTGGDIIAPSPAPSPAPWIRNAGHVDSNGYATQEARKKDDDARHGSASLLAAAAHATVPSWTAAPLMVTLIFGGCCANVRRARESPLFAVEHADVWTRSSHWKRLSSKSCVSHGNCQLLISSNAESSRRPVSNIPPTPVKAAYADSNRMPSQVP